MCGFGQKSFIDELTLSVRGGISIKRILSKSQGIHHFQIKSTLPDKTHTSATFHSNQFPADANHL